MIYLTKRLPRLDLSHRHPLVSGRVESSRVERNLAGPWHLLVFLPRPFPLFPAITIYPLTRDI